MYDVDTMGNPTDWSVAAIEAADRIKTHRFEEHNGATSWWKRGFFVVFGNDGYTQDETSRGAVVGGVNVGRRCGGLGRRRPCDRRLRYSPRLGAKTWIG